MSNLRIPQGDALPLLATWQGLADLQDRSADELKKRPKVTGKSEGPEPRPNDHAKHLRLIAEALRARHE